MHAAFNHPETLRAISEAAGMEVVPIMPIEIGHTNYQLNEKGVDGVYELGAEPTKAYPPAKEIPVDDGSYNVNWHYDGSFRNLLPQS